MKQANKTSSHLLLMIGALGLCGIVGVAAWWMGRITPPDPNASTLELISYTSSDAFAKLSLNEKKPYIETIEQRYFDDPDQFENLPEDQRETVRRTIGSAAMDLRVQKYMEFKSEYERKKYVDEQLDQMQKRTLSMMARRMAGKSTARPPFAPPKGFSPQQQKNSLENRDSVRLAAQMQFMQAVAERAEERGIPLPGPFSKR